MIENVGFGPVYDIYILLGSNVRAFQLSMTEGCVVKFLFWSISSSLILQCRAMASWHFIPQMMGNNVFQLNKQLKIEIKIKMENLKTLKTLNSNFSPKMMKMK